MALYAGANRTTELKTSYHFFCFACTLLFAISIDFIKNGMREKLNILFIWSWRSKHSRKKTTALLTAICAYISTHKYHTNKILQSFAILSLTLKFNGVFISVIGNSSKGTAGNDVKSFEIGFL